MDRKVNRPPKSLQSAVFATVGVGVAVLFAQHVPFLADNADVVSAGMLGDEGITPMPETNIEKVVKANMPWSEIPDIFAGVGHAFLSA